MYVYIWCTPAEDSGYWHPPGLSYFGLSAVVSATTGATFSTTSLTEQQAYAIDSKIDDGLPQSGNVLALYIDEQYSTWDPQWAAGPFPNEALTSAGNSHAPGLNALAAVSTSCYDNGGTSGKILQYNVSNNGTNCALSFRLQAGD